jgi:oligosaccharide translocation protein RFT1
MASDVDRSQAKPPQDMDGTASISSTLKTGRSLVLLQLLTRVLTFVLNQSLVRLASPEVFGTAAIQFDLIYTTILFLSREGIRNALLRSTTNIALARLPLKLGVGVAGVVMGIYLYSSNTLTAAQEGFYLALGLYVGAALVELWVEPMYIQTIRSGRMRVRVQAEGGMAIVKAVVTFLSLVLAPEQALLGFALGQFGGAVWLAGRYIWEFGLSLDR